MEVEPAGAVTVPMSKIVDLDKIEGVAACLELIEESKERSLSKERSQTPLVNECEESREPMSADSVQQIYETNQKVSNVEDKSPQKYTKSPSKSLYEDIGGNASESSNTNNNNSNNNNKIANETMLPSKKTESASVFESKVPNESDGNKARNEAYLPRDTQQSEPTEGDFKKLKEKALSLDSELSNEVASPPAKPVERRRSKIFETAEKFNQLASTAESEKPKKIFIPGVNVGGAKRAFERKASLSSITSPPPAKTSASKVIIDVPTESKKNEKDEKQTTSEQTTAVDDKSDNKRDEAKKRAVDIITGAIGKPPMQRKPMNGSPPISPQNSDSKKLGLKIQVAPNDVRSATVSISTPVETKFAFDAKSSLVAPEATVSVMTLLTPLYACFIHHSYSQPPLVPVFFLHLSFFIFFNRYLARPTRQLVTNRNRRNLRCLVRWR